MIVEYKNYVNSLQQALWSIDTSMVQRAADCLVKAAKNQRTIFVCGNGGSAAIADHLTCDCLKGIRTDTALAPRVVSLSSNGPLITAIANDISYEQIFAYQLKSLAKPKDVLITISSSGNSPNIREAINMASEIGMHTIGMCGFSGGASLETDIPIHVNSNNYGIVEDCHQSIMHIISQYIRTTRALPGAELKL